MHIQVNILIPENNDWNFEDDNLKAFLQIKRLLLNIIILFGVHWSFFLLV